MEQSNETSKIVAQPESANIHKISQIEETQYSWDDMSAVMELALYMGEWVGGENEIKMTTTLQKLVDKTIDRIKMLDEENDRMERIMDAMAEDLPCDWNEYVSLLLGENEDE